MTARYRVRDWGVHFENSRSRDYKKLDWVPIPNKHDGKGYRRHQGDSAERSTAEPRPLGR